MIDEQVIAVLRASLSDDGTIIGHCGAWAPHDNPRLAHIAELGVCVAPAWQGRGVGSALLSAIMVAIVSAFVLTTVQGLHAGVQRDHQAEK